MRGKIKAKTKAKTRVTLLLVFSSDCFGLTDVDVTPEKDGWWLAQDGAPCVIWKRAAQPGGSNKGDVFVLVSSICCYP